MVCGPRTGRKKLKELVYAEYVTERAVLGMMQFGKERGMRKKLSHSVHLTFCTHLYSRFFCYKISLLLEVT